MDEYEDFALIYNEIDNRRITGNSTELKTFDNDLYYVSYEGYYLLKECWFDLALSEESFRQTMALEKLGFLLNHSIFSTNESIAQRTRNMCFEYCAYVSRFEPYNPAYRNYIFDMTRLNRYRFGAVTINGDNKNNRSFIGYSQMRRKNSYDNRNWVDITIPRIPDSIFNAQLNMGGMQKSDIMSTDDTFIPLINPKLFTKKQIGDIENLPLQFRNKYEVDILQDYFTGVGILQR